jgi:threonylcarbamoyladenosine tRNA methylthiotransferase MtaB
MGRKYTASQYFDDVEKIKDKMPYAAISTDVIVGFPGEDEERFEESLSFVKRIGFAKVHVFPFSARPGTPAEKLKDQIPKKIKTKHSAIMQAAADELRRKYLRSMIGKKASVLLETVHGQAAEGYTGEYIRVCAEDSAPKVGEIMDVVLDKSNIVFD